MSNNTGIKRVYFTMVETPSGKVRGGNAYASEKDAEEWAGFVSNAYGGRPVSVESLDLIYDNGKLSEQTIKELDERFNLDAPD